MIEEKIEQARQLRREDALEDSQKVLLGLYKRYPEHPLVLYELGGAFDVLGETERAIPFYEQAVVQGLEGDDLLECYVCLGNCYLAEDEQEKAVAVLQKGIEAFPEKNSSRAFLALAHYSNGEEETAVKLLLELLVKTTKVEDLLSYEGVFEYYIEHLDEF